MTLSEKTKSEFTSKKFLLNHPHAMNSGLHFNLITYNDLCFSYSKALITTLDTHPILSTASSHTTSIIDDRNGTFSIRFENIFLNHDLIPLIKTDLVTALQQSTLIEVIDDQQIMCVTGNAITDINEEQLPILKNELKTALQQHQKYQGNSFWIDLLCSFSQYSKTQTFENLIIPYIEKQATQQECLSLAFEKIPSTVTNGKTQFKRCESMLTDMLLHSRNQFCIAVLKKLPLMEQLKFLISTNQAGHPLAALISEGSNNAILNYVNQLINDNKILFKKFQAFSDIALIDNHIVLDSTKNDLHSILLCCIEILVSEALQSKSDNYISKIHPLLSKAARKADDNTVSLLCQLGKFRSAPNNYQSSIDNRFKDNQTALIQAAAADKIENVAALLQNGANRSLLDDFNNTVDDYLKKFDEDDHDKLDTIPETNILSLN